MIVSTLSRAVVLSSAILLGGCSVFGSAAAPEPEYVQVQASGGFEVRDYPQLVLVKTTMNGEEDPAFMRLFRYISGDNSGKREIAMTAPVLEAQTGAEIAMTAPVLQNDGANGQSEMAFILTSDFTPETAPLPEDPQVSLATVPARRVAVISFSGRVNDDMVADNEAKLQKWIADNGLQATGPAELAQYNPPWTIPAMRRNEILIPIDGR